MTNNANFVKDCIYTYFFQSEIEDPANPGAFLKAEVGDVRYNTEPIGGKLCIPMIDGEQQDEASKAAKAMVDKFYNETLSQLNESGVTDYVNDTIACW